MILDRREDTTERLSPRELFTLVRDIPYKLAGGDPEALIRDNHGECTRKHLFLAPRFRKLGYKVDIGLAIFDWRDLPIPSEILALLQSPIQHHMFLYAEKDGRRSIIDATWDKKMSERGFPLIDWQDEGNMNLAVNSNHVKIVHLPILQARAFISQSIKNVKGIANDPPKTPFNDAFNDWLGRGTNSMNRTHL
ncbi:hypothetical protein HZC27_02050 [Candidatus Roizmanbacteria bacterium]|nr:hypothetical protein [Candidatus Roizmanbacteria bacterium]